MKEEKKVKRLLVPLAYDKKLIVKGDGRVYNDAILLKCGEFSDSISNSPIVYTREELMKVPSNIDIKSFFALDDDRVFLNTDHEPDKVLSRIGYVPNIHFSGECLMGDIYLHCLTSQSRDVKVLIDAGYINYLSVEIMTNDRYSHKDRKMYAENISLIGVATVTLPACPSAKIVSDR